MNNNLFKFLVKIIIILFFGIFLSACDGNSLDILVGVWTSHDDVEIYDENDPDLLIVEFTVDTTMTVTSDGSFTLTNELDGYDYDLEEPWDRTERYTGTWEAVSATDYNMRADDIDVWGDGVGIYDPTTDTYSTVWIEPRGTFYTTFARSE